MKRLFAALLLTFGLVACDDGFAKATITVRSQRVDAINCWQGNCDTEHVVVTTDGEVFDADQDGLYSILGIGHTYRIGWAGTSWCDKPRPCIETVYGRVK